MGSNLQGQLGIDEPDDLRNSPVLVDKLPQKRINTIACGGNRTFVVVESGEVWSWGEGIDGALGQGKLQNAFAPAKV
jgi:alpha-tubulin suppressor-like RCC1 family protein